MIKLVIFDFGRTLFDSGAKQIFPESENVLTYCKDKGYRIACVSLVSALANATLQERKDQIQNSGLAYLFEKIVVTDGDKDKSFEETIKYFGIDNSEVCIVDDRTIRGIRFGNKNGCQTVWFQNGKFADELPNEDTGKPTYIIHSLNELKGIL